MWLVGPSGTKRRRADPFLKDRVALEANAQSSSRGAGAELKAADKVSTSLQSKWTIERLCFTQAACHLSARVGSRVFHSTFDASRIGEPALDLLMHLVWSHAGQVTLPLPPAVPAKIKPLPIEISRTRGLQKVKNRNSLTQPF